MRSNPYPVPPSRIWSTVMAGTYAALALAGALVLVLIPLVPQPVEGVVVLALWGGLTAPASLACLWGVVRVRYRWEWMGAWGIVMGTSIYLVVTVMGTIGAGTLLTSLPTLLIFLALIGMILARAVQLSLIDYQARKRVLAERAVTGEIPEVPVNE